MALQNDTSRIQYNGNNSTSNSYAIPFVFFENSHIKCVVTTSAGVDTELTLGSTFNVTGAGNANGGSLTTTTAVPTSSKVTIFRNVPATQTTSYQEGGDFPAASHERALDKLTMIAQQTKRLADRALKVPETQNNPNDLPNAGTGQKLLVSNSGTLGWDENRNPPPYPATAGTQALVTAGSGAAPSWQTIPAIATGPITATGSTTPRFLGDRFGEVANVKDFGAVGDGVANDAPAIRAAFASALTTGKPVYFPSGNYNCATYSNGQTSGSGQIVLIENQSLTAKSIKVIGDNATLTVPETVTCFANQLGFGFVFMGYFDSVHIEGLNFIHKHPLPTANYNPSNNQTNATNKWPGRIFALLFYANVGAHASNITPTKRVPNNVHITNCSFVDWTQGVNIWYANNVVISDCKFYHTYGQWTAGHDDWTQFVGGRTIGEFRFDRNYCNGFSGPVADVFTALPSAEDVRCSDGGILISGYGPTGYTRSTATNNVVANFQREGLFFNHNEFNILSSNQVGNLSDKPFYPVIFSDNYLDGTCPQGVANAYNAPIVTQATALISGNICYRGQINIFVYNRGFNDEHGPHYSRISDNIIVLAEGDQPGLDNNNSIGVQIIGPHGVSVENNTIYGRRLGSLNNGWNGQVLQPNDPSANVSLTTGISIQGSQNTATNVTGTTYPLYTYFNGRRGANTYPCAHVRNNKLICISTIPGQYATAFSIGAGNSTVIIQNNILEGWPFAITSPNYSGYKRVLFTQNECTNVGRLLSGLLHSGQEGIHVGDHTFTLYPTHVGWYSFEFFTQSIGQASVDIDVPRIINYGDTQGLTERGVQSTSLIVGFSNQTSNSEATVNQLNHVAGSNTVIPKIRISTTPSLALYVDRVTTTAPLGFYGGGGGGAAGYATISNGAVQSVTLTSGGSGYTSNPIVAVNLWDTDMAGSGAVFSVTRSGGSVSAVTVTNGGSGYASPINIRWRQIEQPYVLSYGPYGIKRETSTPSGTEIDLVPGQQCVLIKGGGNSALTLPTASTSNPAAAPKYRGQVHVNTEKSRVFVSGDTGASTDWLPVTQNVRSGFLQSAFTLANSTTYADTGLQIALPCKGAGGDQYFVRAFVVTNNANSTMGSKFKLQFNGTISVVTPAKIMSTIGPDGSGAYFEKNIVQAWDSAIEFSDASFAGATSQVAMCIEAYFALAPQDTAPILKLQAAQQTANAGNLQILRGSTIMAYRLT